MDPSVKWVGDTFQNGWAGPRNKYIHTVGDTATIKFVPVTNNEGYTGCFRGVDHGIIRLSAAIQPDYTKTTAAGADGNFVPGFGLKFLRSGVPSGNLVAMFSVDGQKSWNFFENDFSNHIPDPVGSGQKALAQKFATATPKIGSVGLSDIATYDQNGKKESNPKFPFEIIFVPDSGIKSRFTSDYKQVFTEQLKTIPSGSTLYKVYTKATPTSGKVQIGNIVLTSKLTPSYFGDKYLFFKHQDMQEDLKIHPEWASSVKVASSNEGCPYLKALNAI
jgi:hypothetical protein